MASARGEVCLWVRDDALIVANDGSLAAHTPQRAYWRRGKRKGQSVVKRHLVFPLDFDSRSHALDEIPESWDEQVKRLHMQNRERLLEALKQEFGDRDFERKLKDFKDLGPAPFSLVSYHNRFFSEVRKAFAFGSYYPALTGACALGERILNHMVLALRDQFKATPEYKRVYRKGSFDDWNVAIETLIAWGILKEAVAKHFHALKGVRNRSIHFNVKTYQRVRDDSLEAIKLLAEIISLRFGFFRKEHEWAIPGTPGAQFIGKDFENDPFLKTFYLPQCPLVGPLYAVKFIDIGVLFLDRTGYTDQEISDEEFAQLFTGRKPADVATSDLPLAADVYPVGVLLRDGSYRLTAKAKEGYQVVIAS